MTLLPPDFKDFLRLLNEHEVEYLLLGGYAVGYHGYPRATADMDIFVNRTPVNAERITDVLREFGFSGSDITTELFLTPDKVIRMGVPPLRIEIITSASGVDFADCYRRRIVEHIDDVAVSFMALDDLKRNKRASGRYKDLADLENLP